MKNITEDNDDDDLSRDLELCELLSHRRRFEPPSDLRAKCLAAAKQGLIEREAIENLNARLPMTYERKKP